MAKPPQPLKLQIEDYPDFDKETAEKLFPKLNQFFDEVSNGLDRGLTSENLRALVKTIDISVVAPSSGVTGSGTPGQLAKWITSTSLGDGGIVAADSFVLHEWKLGEAAAPYADTGSGATPLTVAGTTTPTAGRLSPVGAGVWFPSVSDELSGGAVSEPNASLFAVEAWLLLTEKNVSAFGRILTKAYRNDGTWASPFTSIDIAITSGGFLTYAICRSGALQQYTASHEGALPLGFNHVALSWDGTNLLAFINGNQVANQTPSAGAVDFGTHGPWYVGGAPAHSDPLNGLVTRVRVHSGTARSLSYWQSQWRAVMGWAT